MNSVMSATRPSVATSTVKISAPRSKIREIESQKDSRSLTKNVRNLLGILHFNINNFMNFEIIYKKKLNRSFPGLPINGRFMERLEGNRLYFLLGNEKILDIFYSENDVEYQVKSKKTNFSFKKILMFSLS